MPEPRRPHRAFAFLTLLLLLATIDSFAAIALHEHPAVSPAALVLRAAACALAGYFVTRTRADAVVSTVGIACAAILSTAISDAVILAASPPIAPGFAGMGRLLAGFAIPLAAGVAGAAAAVVLHRRPAPDRA